MKNPVLHIKKGVEQYFDPPPGSGPQPPGQRRPGDRPLQGKLLRSAPRRSRLTFFPLLILAIALVVVFRIVPRAPTNRATLMGWNVVLRAMPYGEALLVSVTFIEKARPGVDPGGRPAPRAAVRFVLPDTGEQLTLSEDLLKSPTTLHGQMPYTDAVRKVLATVNVGTETRTLSLAARKGP
ncbi:MAG: hypothetical protein ABSB63_00395 [Spirochaetia bacterium]|jgi:hypothetical protein